MERQAEESKVQIKWSERERDGTELNPIQL